MSESSQASLGQPVASTDSVLDVWTKVTDLNLLYNGLVLNFDNVNSEHFQNTRELEAMNALDLLDSDQIQLDNFLPEQESNIAQNNLINLSQTESEDAKPTEFSGNPNGLVPLPHLLSFDELPEI